MDGMSCMSYVAYGSARRIRTVPPESARSHYSTQAPGEQRASASPSPPLEERAGERRPLHASRCLVHWQRHVSRIQQRQTICRS